MKRYILTLILTTGLFLGGCSQETTSFEETEEYLQLKEEIRELKVENGRLKTENIQLKKSYQTLLKRQRD